MKQSLQLKISQSLTMTPQLQQAIKLLQLSSLDLQSEIQQALDSNPLLESENNESLSEIESNANNAESQNQVENSSDDFDTSTQIQSDKIETDLTIDTKWEDWGYVSQGSNSGRNNDDSSSFDYQGETSESLQDQLQWQIDMMNISDVDKAIATILIDAIDERGYVQLNLEDVVEMFAEENEDLIEDPESESQIELEEVSAVLHLLQSFEPAGIAARNLQECLLLQLKRDSNDTPSHKLAQKIVQEQFPLLSSRNYRQIMRATGTSELQLKEAIEIIQSLDPRPGNQISQNTAQYITPDVYVTKDSKGVWGVELNNSSSPKLKINSDYASLIKRADNSAENVYLKNNLQDAKWFIKSLQSRNETLLKVTSCIVAKQIGFLEYGEEAMKPLVLNDVAEEVEMHESTISRVTTQKYMHTPRGIFELKYFFSSHVGTTTGGECSSTAIRAVIKKLIAAENQAKPLSDSKLANLLKEQGIKVARRTVAKYREAMSIPPSNERKKLI
ncbi:RNA polymerase factor sigma-54 [Aliikangiella coralliicola]|uniref:RNA polymerase sigma-54 factor n=1 Tax=Aliikangiella coralliicola TaxID=2592383 RepID=A0A545UK02_9GAMM|nr:RNA polymerase factor sigma-54 [Aliikangiella coralliicola]TQV89786.1 RNA polymerase factor sigma-54 [Aliikangiella coralliicola]